MRPAAAPRRTRRPYALALTSAALAGAFAAPLAAREAELIGPAGKCLGLAEAGSHAVLETCTQAADQRWQLPSAGFDGPILGAGGLCLDVANAASDDRTAIQVFACHGGANQRWRLQDDGRLIGLAGKCLDIEGGGTGDGTPALLFGCHGGDHQRFLAVARNAWSRLPLLSKRKNSGEIFAGEDGVVYLDSRADDGLLRSADGGRSWSVVPVERGWSRNRALALVDRTHSDRLFATAAQGLLVSQDGGRSWVVAVEQGELVRQSPVDGSHFFAASPEGLFRSVDRGTTFQRLANLPAESMTSTALAIARDGDLYLSRHGRCNDNDDPCGQEAKLYRSRDLGATWGLLRSEAFSPGEDLVAHPTAAGTLYWLHGQPDGLMPAILERSDDDGATWTRLVTPQPIYSGARIHPAAPDDLWLSDSGRLLRSRDGGASWQAETVHSNPIWSASSLAFSAGKLLVLASTGGLSNPEGEPALLASREEDGWVSLPFPRDGLQPMVLAAAAARPGRFYASRLDLWRTDDSGRTWTQVQEEACPASIAADPELPDTLYLGASDCDWDVPQAVVQRSTDGGETLEPVGPVRLASTEQIRAFPWQGGTAVVALSRDRTSDEPAVVVRSFDRFQTWSTVALPGSADSLFVDGSGDGVLFASDTGSRSIFRSFDAGQTWDTIEAPGYRFAAGAGLALTSSLGTLHLSRDAGATWRTISAPFAWASTGSAWATIDPQGRILLIAEDSRLLASADEGRTWQWLAQDQPDARAYSVGLAFDPFDAQRILVATGHGPYLAHFAPSTATPAPPLALSERFEARLAWRDGVGGSGEGHGKRLTDHTGLFTLFTPERAEVAIKLLDARAINGRFWVFVASMTHVELDLEILDRLTGERRTYHNPLGQLASFGDTDAFPRGPATPSVVAPPTRVTAATPVSDRVTAGGRFTVEVAWTDPLGQSGAGLGFPLSHDTAAFYFFDRSNIELLVNVVDGRPLNGHFWVFFGSLSNVAYQVTVTDTSTGQRRVYDNPAGTFASFSDTSAF